MFLTDRIEQIIEKAIPAYKKFMQKRANVSMFGNLKYDTYMSDILRKNNKKKCSAITSRKKNESKREHLKRLLNIRSNLRRLPKPAQQSRLHNALNIEVMKLLKKKRKVNKERMNV
jgi:hypothetical protein